MCLVTLAAIVVGSTPCLAQSPIEPSELRADGPNSAASYAADEGLGSLRHISSAAPPLVSLADVAPVVLPTAAYPQTIPDWLGLLRCEFNPKAVGNAIAQWNAQDLEDATAERAMIGSICRSPEEWLSHPQGAILADKPLIEIEKIGDSEPELPPLKNKERPLSGLKVARSRM